MKTKFLDLETIIAQRLNLETNRRILWDEFGVSFANLEKVKNPFFLKENYKNWTQDKKDRFAITIGGKVNFKTTQEYLQKILEN